MSVIVVQIRMVLECRMWQDTPPPHHPAARNKTTKTNKTMGKAIRSAKMVCCHVWLLSPHLCQCDMWLGNRCRSRYLFRCPPDRCLSDCLIWRNHCLCCSHYCHYNYYDYDSCQTDYCYFCFTTRSTTIIKSLLRMRTWLRSRSQGVETGSCNFAKGSTSSRAAFASLNVDPPPLPDVLTGQGLMLLDSNQC